MAGYVSDAVIRRLPGYYRHLRELEAAGVTQISSQELGKRMQLTPSQIRQDINCFGGFGRQGYGYKVSDLKMHIGEILGLNRMHRMIILGVGNIGSAVANYPTFNREGFETVAMFDVDPGKIGTRVGNVPVYPMDELENFLGDNKVDVAVLAVPVKAAQETMDRLSACHVGAVWNFAPTDLHHPDDMIVVNVHLSDSLQILSYKMAHAGEA
ncbi:MAG: redox-sensing transcriptional repressor Rex [Clostridia bacterium]|nr:redox-sensing transcriptional repressor Rex [Clostridia bacterium]